MRFILPNQAFDSCAADDCLRAYVEPFAESLLQQGYSPGRTSYKRALAASFSGWIKDKEIPISSVASQHTDRYLRFRARHVQIIRGDRGALKHFLDFLRRQTVIPSEGRPAKQRTPAAQLIDQYGHHLRNVRGLKEVTIQNYAPYASRFLEQCFADDRVELSRLKATHVLQFVRREAPRMQVRSAKLMITALRSFLQYGRYCGAITADLAAAVPTAANWSNSSIPKGIDPDDCRRLLASIERTTPMGRRDYAIVLMLMRLGLRAGEVTGLELDDIDWQAGRLRVRGKSGPRGELPLLADVGKAIAVYLRLGRPQSRCRRVFLRVQAPIQGFGPDGIGSMIRGRLIRAGIEAPTYGTHQFRYGLATTMLRKGASLTEIGDLLGHRSEETTKTYAKVDIDSLRTLALPWPRGAR